MKHEELAEKYLQEQKDRKLREWMQHSHSVLDEIVLNGESVAVRNKNIRTSKPIGMLLYQIGHIDSVLKLGSGRKFDDNGHRKMLETLKDEPRWKLLAQISDRAFEGLESLKQTFPNFEHVLDALSSEMALHRLGARQVLQFEPKLLVGPPGVGKTRFLSEVAKTLGTTFYQKSLATTTSGFALAGMHKGWSGATTGFVVDTLRQSCVANPIIMLDEIDKVGGDKRHDPEKVFLTLFERHSAKTFEDEFLQFPFDCSAINWFATANEPKFISEPILSRLQYFTIASPTAEQTVNIVNSVYRELVSEHDWGKQFAPKLSDDVIEALVQLSPRLIKRALIEACAGAAKRTGNAKKIIRIERTDMEISSPKAKRAIGFF